MGAQGCEVQSGFAATVLEVDVVVLVVDEMDVTEVDDVAVLDWEDDVEELLVDVTVGEVPVEVLVRLEEVLAEPPRVLEESEK